MCHLFLMVSWSGVGHVLYAALTPLIAAIVAYIAWQQYGINHRQHRLALFEKRMVVVNSTMKFIATVVQSANPSLEECLQFMRETRDNTFLFGPEVGKFIDETYRKATALRAHIAMGPNGAAKVTEILTWFTGQLGGARKVFLPYVDFRKP